MSKKLFDFKAKDTKPFSIRAKSNSVAELIIYDQIGESWFAEGVTAKAVSEALKDFGDVKEIHVRINSPGGDCFQGIAIYNRLKQHKAKKIVYIDGLCASIASIIALAGDEIIVGEGALTMWHLPWTMAMGNRNEIDNTLQRLGDVENQLVGIYMKKTGLSRAEITEMLEKETWFDAQEIIDVGAADKLAEDSLPIAASIFEKSEWIHKAPKNFKSETKVIENGIANLQMKIKDVLARK